MTTRLRLRDGESNLLAGLLQERTQNGVTGFPGAIHLPFLKQLFSSNSEQSDQTDIVMLLTPHIVRTSEITESDLKPIYIGSQNSLGVGGPPPLIEAPPVQQPEAPARAAAAPATPPIRTQSGALVTMPPGSSPVPGTVPVPPPAQTPPAPAAQPPATAAAQPPAAPAQAAAQPPAAAETPPITSPGIGSAQVIVSPPGTTFRVGGGPVYRADLRSPASRASRRSR